MFKPQLRQLHKIIATSTSNYLFIIFR